MSAQYRFYSRKQGWIGSNLNSKYFYTDIITIKKNIGNQLEGMTGKEIVDSKITSDTSLMKFAKIYSDWYFYHSTIKIGCSTEYYL